jgi:hypothetical protein
MAGEAGGSGNEYAREASDEERAFHAAQTSGNEPGGGSGNGNYGEPRESAPREPAPPRDDGPRDPGQAEAPREQRGAGSQAPLDLPPPPASKPFVVWSSSPGGTSDRRDE